MVFEVWLQRRQCHTPRSCMFVKKGHYIHQYAWN